MTRPTGDPGPDCELCEEVDQAGAGATGRGAAAGWNRPFSRLVDRLPVVDVISGLGSLRPGYLLVVPRQHVNSSGELADDEFRQLWRTVRDMCDRISAVFGSRVVAVEHGSSGYDHGQACVVHAHVHLFPIDRDGRPEDFVPVGCQPADDLLELRRLADERRNYFFCSWAAEAGRLLADPALPSQYARRVWADGVGRPDEWDWAVFPELANCRTTTDILRCDMPSTVIDDEPTFAAETVDAYDSAAEWYAARTRKYPPNSTLQAEIRELAERTSGTILDAGAGAGRDAQEFARLERDVIALDASKRLLEQVPRHRRITRRPGDVTKLNGLPSRSVGAVWCSAVLLHLNRREIHRALTEFRRVLTAGGLLQISVKEGQGITSEPMAGRFHRYTFYYRQEELLRLVHEAGFTVERTWFEDEHDGASRSIRWRKVLLRQPTT